MYFRPALFTLFALLIFTFGFGCQKSTSIIPAAPPTVLAPDTIARVHWLGKRRLGYEATAFFLMRVWNLSQTAQLERQTIDRLTTAPLRLLPGGSNLAATSSVLLLPLIYDLEQEQTYFEIRATTNAQPFGATKPNEGGSTFNPEPTFVLALRLNDPAQAGRWFTNLATVLGQFTGAYASVNTAGNGWSLKLTNAPALIQLTRVGDWTIVAAGPAQSPLLAEITIRIKRDHVPFVSAGTNLWLEANLDLPRLTTIFPAFSSQLLTLNRLSLTLTGDGANVITRAQLTFAEPLPLQLEPWHIPLDLMHEPLIGFTAGRGLQPWLAVWKNWQNLPIGTPPDQLFLWSVAGSPYQTYLAAPLPDARQQVSALTGWLLQTANPWLATNGYIAFDRAENMNGVTWGNLPDIKPFITSVETGSQSYLFAGLLPATGTDAAGPPPTGLIQDVLRRTNLVYYDWEITGSRLQPCLQLGQTARQIARRTQMSLDSTSLRWLATVIPRLGTSATIINHTGPNQLEFYRRATLGLTAPELHLLTDWLESPQFPSGLHSTR